ncbi:MAG: hypothetical protein D6710_01810 [Nitrospirae bacterium]|nr:MAG: hypothetical protein D6710_01810 [Nitrospirota bacterium]
MAIRTKTFKLSKSSGVRNVDTFLEEALGKDASLLVGISATSLNENTTQVTIFYKDRPDRVMDITNPIPGLLVASGNGPDSYYMQLSRPLSEFDTLSGKIFFDGSPITSGSDWYIEPQTERYIVSIGLSGKYDDTTGSIHTVLASNDILDIDGEEQPYSELRGFTVAPQAVAFVGNEITYTASEKRGKITLKYSVVDTSVSTDKFLQQILGPDEEILFTATTKKANNTTEIFALILSEREPRIIASSPPFGALHPSQAKFNEIYLTFDKDLDRAQFSDTSRNFGVNKSFGNTVAIEGRYLELLPDDRTLKIDIDQVFIDKSISNLYVNLILYPGLLAADGVETTKPYLLPYVTNDNLSAGGGTPGPPGPPGPPGSGFTWSGSWTSGTSYSTNDVVEHSGSTWVAVSGSTNQEPNTSSTYWDLMAQSGLPGQDGADGLDGRSFIWRGAWSSGTTYDPDDVVEHSGSSWIALLTNLNQEPTPISTYWDLMAQSGSPGSGGGGTTDHGSLTGLLDDDHPQYVPTNASRGFSNPISGVTPVSGYDLTTKSYVDSADNGLQNDIDNLSSGLTTHTGDTTIHYVMTDIRHTQISEIGTNTHAQIDSHIADSSIHFTATSIDHGQLSGLSDDDHTQYVPTDASRGFTNPVSGVTPVSGHHLSTKDYVDTTVSSAGGIQVRDWSTVPDGPLDAGIYTYEGLAFYVESGNKDSADPPWDFSTNSFGTLGGTGQYQLIARGFSTTDTNNQVGFVPHSGIGLSGDGKLGVLTQYPIAIDSSNRVYVKIGPTLKTSASLSLEINESLVPLKYSEVIGDGVSSTIDVVHSIGTQNVTWSIRESGSPYRFVSTRAEALDADTLRLYFSSAPASGQYVVTVIG